MINLGIVTFYEAHNYGAVLQAYALKETCAKLGANAFIYRHRNKKIYTMYNTWGIDLRSIEYFTKSLMTFLKKSKRRRAFKGFIKKRLLNTHQDKCSDVVYISGSDQVWNYNCTGFDKAYFLDFAPNDRKYSYAASFGFDEIPMEYRKEYIRLLKSFKRISVREEQGVSICKNTIGKDAIRVLDPTLLLNETDWKNAFNIKDNKSDYILVYSFSITKGIYDRVNYLQNKTNYRVIVLSENAKSSEYKFENSTYRDNVDPVKWVELFANAKYIVTNSFHGTAFAINFKKEFYVELMPDSFKVNSRLIDVLSLFGLTNRIISDSNDRLNICPPMNCNRIDEVLAIERRVSWTFLKSIIGG